MELTQLTVQEENLVKKLTSLTISDESSSMRELRSIIREVEALTNVTAAEVMLDKSTNHAIWKAFISSLHAQLQSTSIATSPVDTANILIFIKTLVEMQIPQTSNTSQVSESGDHKIEKESKHDYLYHLVLEPILPSVWDFIINTLSYQCNSSEILKSATSLHIVLGVIHRAIRTSLSILKRIDSVKNYHGHCKEHGAEDDDEQLIKEKIIRFGQVLCGLLQNPSLESELDVKCSVGLGICFTVKILHGRSSYLRFFERIFSVGDDVNEVNEFETTILEVSHQTVNRIALAFGALGIMGSNECGISLSLMKAIARNVLAIEHRSKESITLGSARILETWTQKLSEMEIETIYKEFNCLFPDIEFFVYNNLAGHIDAVKSCCRYIIVNLTKIYDQMEDTANEKLVRQFLESFLCKPANIRWTGISWITRGSSKSICLLELEESLPQKLLGSERIFKYAANETYLALMTYHFSMVPVEDWLTLWMTPLFFARQKCQNLESNWSQKRTIIATILKSKNKELTHAVLKYVVLQINSKTLTCPEASQLAVEAIKIATELEIKLNISLDQTEEGDSFRGFIPRNIFNSWLWSGNPQARIAAFSLVVETRKTAEPISYFDFQSMKIFIRYNLVSQNPAFRQQYLACFKKLLRRLTDSFIYLKRKNDKESLQNYEDFFKWLWICFTNADGLFPGANFGRRCQALECLAELATHFDFELFDIKSSPDNLNFLRWFNDSYENNKIMAFRILDKMPMPSLQESSLVETLMNNALTFCASVKPPESVTGRYLVVFLMKKSGTLYSPLNVLTILHSKLTEVVERIEKTSLAEVSGQTAIYGYLSCIRMIFHESKDYLVDHEEYRQFTGKLLDVCFKLNDIFFPLLGCASPEGTLIDKPDDDHNLQVVRSINAQKQLVCSWRSMRDSCLLMTEMCSLFPLEGEKSEYILSYTQVETVGNHLLFLLKNLMHRGVFEQVFVGFKLLATRLYKSCTSNLSMLIEKWLENAMDEELISSKSVTRRSAGLPFIFQALLAPGCNNEAFICKYVSSLFNKESDSPEVRIHIMNILRALFRDANFSRAIMSYVPAGLKLAFRAQANNYWPEQNSGLMLLGSVVRRTFGPTLCEMSASTFFRKFPEMYDFLLDEINSCGEKLKMEKQLVGQSSDFTFYVLVLLSSFASKGVVEDAHFPLSRFVSCIRDCGSSGDVRVRKIAAKALIPFHIDPANQLKTLNQVLQDLKCPNLTSSEAHGGLCVLLAIFQAISKNKFNLETVINDFETLCNCGTLWKYKCPLIFESTAEICVELGQPARYSYQLVYKEFEASFGSFENRQCVTNLPNAYRKLFEAKVFFSLTGADVNTTEIISKWAVAEDLVFMEQLLSFLCSQNLSHYDETTSCTILNALVKRYVETKFCYEGQSKVEELFLEYFCQTTAEVYNDWLNDLPAYESDKIVSAFFEKILHLCEMESGTMIFKAKGVELLGKLAFKTYTNLSDDHEDRLCVVLSLLCDSKTYDEIRFGVAKGLPVLADVQHFTMFTVSQQCKLWYTILVLAQDDECFVREEINSKLDVEFGNICDIKLVEDLIQLCFNNFIVNQMKEGLTLIIGITLRDDYVVAEEADDSEEERLFDKSEINSFNEPLHVAKLVKEYLDQNLDLKNECKTVFHSTKLSKKLIDLYEFVSNSSLTPKNNTEVTLYSICSSELAHKEKNKSNNLSYFAQSDKHCIQNAVREFIINIFN